MHAVLHRLQLHKPASRRLGGAAALLAVSGMVHLGVLVVSGGPWGGAVSFRKPVTFAISFALILWTMGWVIDQLPSKRRLEPVLAYALIGSSLIEVGLITMQTWRGVPSHFNEATTQDALVFAVMGVTIVVMSLALLVLAVWTVVQRPAEPATRLAVVAGMAVLLTGLGLGQWIITLGDSFLDSTGRVPETVIAGESGVVKFPHAMALHGIQLFIGASILAGVSGLGTRERVRVVRMVVAGYSTVVLWSIVHTNAGRAPFDPSGLETGLAVVGAALLGAAGLMLIAARRRSAIRGAVVEATVTLHG